VLAIVLDAADPRLVRSWTEAGHLPVLEQLMRGGGMARLSSPSEWMPEAAWPTMITGCGPGGHGIYSWRSIQPGTNVRRRTPNGTWRQPVWQLLRRCGAASRIVLLDIPYSMPLGDPAVTEVVGWGERGAVRRTSWPPDLLERVVARHGAYPDWVAEDYTRWPLEEARLLATLRRAITRRTDLLEGLLRGDAWDLCMASYSEPHNAAHAFYRHLEPGSWAYHARRARRHSNRLLEVYRAVDSALGRLVATVPDGTDVVVLSGKGFRVNTSGEEVLGRVLTGLGYQVPAVKPGRLRALDATRWLVRTLAPRPLRRRIMSGRSWQERDRILEALWTESTDWARTRAFAETDPGHGCVRLNVSGREPHGIVDPGREYDALCAELVAELRALTHARSGAPAVADVALAREVADGPHVDKLPDLFVKWSSRELLDEVRHPRLGIVRERTKELQTAEHTGEGFLIGSGPSFRQGVELQGGDLADFAPTLLHLMGAPIPTDMDGEVLEGLLVPAGPAGGPVRREPIAWDQDPWALDSASHTPAALLDQPA